MSTSPSQYRNPPVQEAIFSVAFQEALSAESIRSFSQSAWTSAHYPTVTEEETTEEFAPSLSQRPGLKMQSADAGTLLRFSTTQFNFHIVANYPGWETASTAFLAAWHQAETHCQIGGMRYTSIRYINRLQLGPEPADGLEIGDYLRLLPALPDDFPGSPGRFFLQVECFEDQQQLEGLIWETLIPATKENPNWQVLLDINVRSTPDQQPSPLLPDFLQQGRHFKNKLFESCITPAMRALFH